MSHATKTRDTGLVIQLNPALRASISDLSEASKIMRAREFNSYEEFLEKYGEPWSDKAFITLVAYGDGLGYLLYNRLIDIDIIEYLSEGTTTGFWEQVRPLIIGMRKEHSLPSLFERFEYLCEEMKKT